MSEFNKYIDESLENLNEFRNCEQSIIEAVDLILTALKNKQKIIFCGNGGSAADSQHLAAELMGRYLKDRNPLPAI